MNCSMYITGNRQKGSLYFKEISRERLSQGDASLFCFILRKSYDNMEYMILESCVDLSGCGFPEVNISGMEGLL